MIVLYDTQAKRRIQVWSQQLYEIVEKRYRNAVTFECSECEWIVPGTWEE